MLKKQNLDIRPQDRVLEIGIGTVLHPRSTLIVGSDLDTIPWGVPFIHASGEKLPIRDQSFDYVLSSHMAEHLPPEGIDRFLAELQRVAPRGYLEVPSILYEMLRDVPEHHWFMACHQGKLLLCPKSADAISPLRGLVSPLFEDPQFRRSAVDRFSEIWNTGLEWRRTIPVERVEHPEQLLELYDEQAVRDYIQRVVETTETKATVGSASQGGRSLRRWIRGWAPQPRPEVPPAAITPWRVVIACPTCKGALSEQDGRLHCAPCDSRFPIIQRDIPSFLEASSGEAEAAEVPVDQELLLTVLIPAHDEETVLGSTLQRLSGRLKEESIPHEILVVADHCTDGTVSLLREMETTIPELRWVENQAGRGFGMAVRCGLEHYQGDAVAVYMADASDDPEDLIACYKLLQGGAECVFGSRFMRGGRTEDYPPHKYILNRLANRFIQTLFRLDFADVTNAFKVYRRFVIDGCRPLVSRHFNLTVELPLKAIIRGYRHEVIPIRWCNRTSGVSKLRIREMGSRYLYIVLACWAEHAFSRGDLHRRNREAI